MNGEHILCLADHFRLVLGALPWALGRRPLRDAPSTSDHSRTASSPAFSPMGWPLRNRAREETNAVLDGVTPSVYLTARSAWSRLHGARLGNAVGSRGLRAWPGFSRIRVPSPIGTGRAGSLTDCPLRGGCFAPHVPYTYEGFAVSSLKQTYCLLHMCFLRRVPERDSDLRRSESGLDSIYSFHFLILCRSHYILKTICFHPEYASEPRHARNTVSAPLNVYGTALLFATQRAM